ncbi:MAG: glutamate--tRNA ligase, partial [Vulcanimicrobiaceae bacterium]
MSTTPARRVRTRVAPSPTGDPHVGTAYVALVNYAFAKKNDGQFILRIEDTDQARSTPESEQAILDALHWTGLSWDEGPDVGGPFGPYRQSERSAIYAKYAAELLEAGHAFRCFCTPERLDDLRAAQRAAGIPQHYDGNCQFIPADESLARASAGEPFVVRMVVPREGICVVHDMLRGEIEIAWATVDMQVLLKSDGLPTYHLANVVDDHLMEITHVIRGEEWISSAPKHLLLYQYFGWQAPALLHVPLLRNPDRSKLSKRKNPTGILFYEAMGYLPEALLNFLGLLISSSVEGQEMFDLETLWRERFGVEHISLGGPVFDVAKLDWLNGRYLRELTPEQLVARLQGWAFG